MEKKEILKNIEICEKNGNFSEHVAPPNYANMKALTDDYDYMRKGFWNQIGRFFAVWAFRVVGWFIGGYCKLKIVGKKNIKGIKRAIVTCNHINNIDCVLIKQAYPYKKLRITVADFNNPKGFLGSLLRGAGTLPFGHSITLQKKLSSAITEYLNQNAFVLFYPEGSLWWCYEKPRPVLKGAYFYAVKNNAPIIPMFFTFKNLKKRKDGTYKKKFILHIGKPIFKLPEFDDKQNIQYLMEQNFEWNKKIYEEFYGKPLEYKTEKNN